MIGSALPRPSRDASLQRHVLALQRMAGNAAVVSRIRPQPAHNVQRQVQAGLGYTLHPSANLWVRGPHGIPVVRAADFKSTVDDNIDIADGESGTIKLWLQAEAEGSWLAKGSKYEYLAVWGVDASGDNLRLWFQREQRTDPSRQVLAPDITFGHLESGDALQVTFTTTEPSLLGKPREAFQKVTLHIRRPPRIIKVPRGPVRKEQSQEFQPFDSGHADVPAAMRPKVRAFYDSLQKLTRRAMQRNERPGGELVVIEGYASTKGSEAHNDDLGTDRAIAVKKLLQQLSGNTGDDIYVTPSVGESRSPTATDNPRREVDDSKFRKVVVTLWE